MNKRDATLPTGWAWMTLEHCVDILDRHRVPVNREEREKRTSEKDKSELYPYYGATGLVDWIDDYIFDDEIILLGEDGAPFLESNKDKAYIVRGKCWVNNHAHVLRAKNGIATNLFLMHYLNSFDYHEYVTGTTRLKLNQARMRDFPILLPPLPEQERIVERIESLFTQLEAGVAALKRARAALRRYKASVLKAACEGRLVAQEEGDESAEVMLRRILAEKGEVYRALEGEFAELPRGWVWATTGTLCDCIVPNRDKPKSFNGDIPWITLPDFNGSIEIRDSKVNLGLSREEAYKYRARIIPEGSVVMSCVGRFGITAVAARDIVVNQQLHAFLIRKDYLDNRYLAYAIRTQIPYMENKATATTIAYLNKENCNSVPIPYPPLAEQQRIVAEVERRLSVVQELEVSIESSIRRAGRLRQVILKNAFEGRL